MQNRHIIGLGGAGSNIIQSLYGKGLEAKFSIITHPLRDLKNQKINQILFEHNYHPLQYHKVVNLDYVLPENLRSICNSNEHTIIIAGIGGYTGVTLINAYASYLKQNNYNFSLIYEEPFEFEIAPQLTYIYKALEILSGYDNAHAIKLNRYAEKYRYESILKVFDIVEQDIYNLVSEL